MTARIKPATDKQKRSLETLVRDALNDAINRGEISSAQTQEIIKRGGDFKRLLEPELLSALRRFAIPPNVVHVPELSAMDLTAALKRERNLTYLDPDQGTWDFYTDQNGNPVPGRWMKFEVKIWKPGRQVSSNEVREHFREDGFTGHVGAFEQWLRTVVDPSGYYASIPEDSACWRGLVNGSLCAPYSIFDGGNRKLNQNWIDNDWNDNWSFVGFRDFSL